MTRILRRSLSADDVVFVRVSTTICSVIRAVIFMSILQSLFLKEKALSSSLFALVMIKRFQSMPWPSNTHIKIHQMKEIEFRTMDLTSSEYDDALSLCFSSFHLKGL